MKFKPFHLNFKLIVLFIWLVTSLLGVALYPGYFFTYFFFSLVFFVLLLDGVFFSASYSYSILVALLVLAFPAKLLAHLVFDYSYLEPTGNFSYSAADFDIVLVLASVGALGVLISRYLFHFLCVKYRLHKPQATLIVPFWYERLRMYLWFLCFLVIACTAIVQFSYLLDKDISNLIDSFGVVTAWIVGFGGIFSVLTLVFWDSKNEKRWKLGFLAVLLESFLSSIVTVSRINYILHSLSYLYIFLIQKINFSLKKKICLFVVWISLFFISIGSVQILRYSDSSPLDISGNKTITLKLGQLESPNYLNAANEMVSSFSHLVLDRWIGLEGLMSVASFPYKGFDLFNETLFERRDVHVGDIYTLAISNEDTQDMKFYESMKTYPYASIPGVMAFFYYTGNSYFLFFGMVFIVFVMMLLEYLVMFLTKNPYLDMMWASMLAFSVANFGLAVYECTVYYLFCLFSIFCLCGIQELSSKKNPQKSV